LQGPGLSDIPEGPLISLLVSEFFFNGNREISSPMKCISDAVIAARNYAPLMLLYFCSSCAQAFPMVSVASILNKEFGLSASELALYYTTIFIPWNFRALYGLCSDLIPVRGYRRIPYMFAFNLLLGLCYLLYGLVVSTENEAFAVGVTLNVFFAFSEAVLDAAVIGKIRAYVNQDGSSSSQISTVSCDVQSASMTFRTTGSLVSFLVAGTLSKCMTPRSLLAMSSMFPVVSSLVVLFARNSIEPESSPQQTLIVFEKTGQFVSYIRECVSKKRMPQELFRTIKPVVIPSIFILLYASCPTSNVVFVSYLYSLDIFDQFQFHVITLCGIVGGLVGTLLYWGFFRRVQDTRKIFVVSVIFSIFAVSSRLLIVYVWKQFGFICMDETLVNIAARFTLMPVQVYASIAASTPEHMMYEGFVFGFFASIENWGGTISGFISSAIAADLTVSSMILTCAGISVVPLFALSLLRYGHVTPIQSHQVETESPQIVKVQT
jgi:hypothetical protein